MQSGLPFPFFSLWTNFHWNLSCSFPKSPFHNVSVEVWVITRRQTGDKSLPKPMMAQTIDAFIRLNVFKLSTFSNTLSMGVIAFDSFAPGQNEPQLADVIFQCIFAAEKYITRGFDNCSQQIDGLVQERRNSNALAMELRLSCFNPLLD